MNLRLMTAEGEEIELESVPDELVTDEMTTSEIMISLNNHLENIDRGISTVCVVGIVLIVWLGLWTVLDKWYFGGV